MIIQEDTGNKIGKHKNINYQLEHMGHEVVRHGTLMVGDYTIPNNQNISIDTKQDLPEICGNFSDIPKKDKQGKYKKYPDGTLMTEKKTFYNGMRKSNQNGY